MIKLALETLFSQALVYDRNPHDPREISADRKPLKFTHCLVDSFGTEMLYDEKSGELYGELLKADFDPLYSEREVSYSVIHYSRGNLKPNGLHGWLFANGNHAVRLDYQAPRVRLNFPGLLKAIEKDRSMVEGVKLIARVGQQNERIYYVYENYEVREVIYNPFTDEFMPDMDNEPKVYAGPDGERNYSHWVKSLPQTVQVCGRDTFAPQVTATDPADYINRPNDTTPNPRASNLFPHLADATKVPTDQS